MMVAYAVVMSEENMLVIASEHPKFDKAEFRKWLADHGEGYFLRDESSPLDCQYFEPTVFAQMYLFESGDESALFRRVVKID